MTTEKSKLKHTPVSRVRYWWNLFLFARSFEMQAEAPAHAIAGQIANLDDPPTVWRELLNVNIRSKFARTKLVEPDHLYQFDIRYRVGNFERIRANGRIVRSEGYNATIVRGQVRLAWFHLMWLVASMMLTMISLAAIWMFAAISNPELSVIAALFCLIVTGFRLILMVVNLRFDYRNLTRDLLQAISAGAVESLNDLAPESGDSPFVDEADEQQTIVS